MDQRDASAQEVHTALELHQSEHGYVDDDVISQGTVKRPSEFRKDLGKRAREFPADLGKRRSEFRKDLGKRSAKMTEDQLGMHSEQNNRVGYENVEDQVPKGGWIDGKMSEGDHEDHQSGSVTSDDTLRWGGSKARLNKGSLEEDNEHLQGETEFGKLVDKRSRSFRHDLGRRGMEYVDKQVLYRKNYGLNDKRMTKFRHDLGKRGGKEFRKDLG